MTGISSFVSGLTNFAAEAFGDEMVQNAVNGALFGAVSTAIGGGDILEGAAWGAAGNMVRGAGDEGIFGTFSNEAGAAIAGYGIDKSMGGDGLLGAALGAGAESIYSQGDTPEAPVSPDKEPNYSPTRVALDSPGGQPVGTASSKFSQLLEDYGLQDTKGDGTLLGKGLLSAGMGYAQSKMVDDAEEKAAKTRRKESEQKADLDERFEQRNLRAFTSGSPLVVRNG